MFVLVFLNLIRQIDIFKPDNKMRINREIFQGMYVIAEEETFLIASQTDVNA